MSASPKPTEDAPAARADATGSAARAPRLARAAGWALAAILLAAAVLPLWAGRWLPFLDLPQHVGLASVIHHYGDPAWDFQRYYVLDHRPLPYWGFYLPVDLFAYLLPITVAAKVVLSLYAVALPIGLWRLLRVFGRDGRLAVIGVPLVYNTNLFMGFTSFVVALPIWLFAVAEAERWLAAPEGEGAARRGAVAGVLAVAVYFAHGQAFLLLVCAVGLLWLAHGPRLRSLLPFAPAAALMVYWIVAVVAAPAAEVASAQHRVVLGRLGVIGRLGWNTPGENLSRLGEYLFDVYSGPVEDGLFIGLFGVLLVLVVMRAARGVPEGRGFLHRWRLELLALGLALSYFVSPMEIGLQWYVSPRHLVFAALLVPAFAGTAPFAGWRRWLLVPLVGLALAIPIQASTEVRRFQAKVGPFDEVLAAAEQGGRTLGLIYDNGGGAPVRTWPLLHYAAWIQAEKGGDLGFSFAGLPSIPVRYRPGMQAPHPYEWRPEQFDWNRYARYYDQILVRGTPTGSAALLNTRARLVVRAGPWALYRLPHEGE